MKTIKQNYRIKASITRVWNAFIDPEEIEKWHGGPAIMTDKEGETFSLWGGDIHGKNIKIEKEKILIQEWYSGKWNIPSLVTFSFEEKDGTTKIHLVHENIPDNEATDISDGWKEYYLGPIKEYVEEQ